MITILLCLFLLITQLRVDAAPLQTSITAQPRWETPFFARGPSSGVLTLDVLGDAVVVGGSFHGADDVLAQKIARWDGSRWRALAGGSPSSQVDVVRFDAEGGLFVAGSFEEIGGAGCNGVAYWKNGSWDCLDFPFEAGAGFSGMVPIDTVVYLATDESHFFRLEKGQWDTLTPALYGRFNRLRDVGGRIWVGGDFHVKSDTTLRNLLFHDGEKWVEVGRGIGHVRDFSVLGGQVFAIEQYRKPDRTDSQTVVLWNGTEWSRVDGNLPRSTFANLTLDSQSLYLTGWEADRPRFHLYKWDGQKFVSHLDEPFFGEIVESVFYQGRLYLGGGFPGMGHLRAENLICWDRGNWKAFTTGVSTGPYFPPMVMTSNGQELLLGGSFLRFAGDQPAGGIVKWDGLRWDDLGGGFKDPWPIRFDNLLRVKAIGVRGEEIYAGGYFDSSWTGPARNMARWDGRAWMPMGDGFPGVVNDIEIVGNEVFAGGLAGSGPDPVPVSPLAGQAVGKWNGTAWEKMGDGIQGEVLKLAHYKGQLYVAGRIRLAGNDSVRGIVRWSGAQWEAIESAYASVRIDSIFDMALFDDELYLLGHLPGENSLSNSLMSWDGRAFEHRDLITTASALAADEEYLYLSAFPGEGNYPGIPGKCTLARLRKGDQQWEPLTSAMGSFLYREGVTTKILGHSLVVHGDYLYVGSRFSALDGKPAYSLARWNRTGSIGIKRSNLLARQKKQTSIWFSQRGIPGRWHERESWNLEVFDVQGRKQPSTNAAGMRLVKLPK